MNCEEVLSRIQGDPRYQSNLDWGKPRSGHPEGSVRAHIAELERNLNRLRPRLTALEAAKLRVLIHTHDTFKGDAAEGVPITDPRSHASLARAFLQEYCDDPDLLAMVQWHDEPYALWRQWKHRHVLNSQRLEALISRISDWNLFLAFNLVDGCTDGKDRDCLHWFLGLVGDRVQCGFGESDIF
ncbi:hypothetical protein Pan44_00890 [Caulifigura coniformis]|uniref:HD domain-containing protein n=1 Tax=Caulifigura coniformis TaxID=2527983 RepID=A0A517S7G8_9PLAN|nr:hypothetical protein [Caulifigura coniformis]QDT52081.1 hypothetical protein Pan44_00890 [Caulifigura coniformis]